MSRRTAAPKQKDASGFDRGFEGHWRRLACPGFALTPTEQLHWLKLPMEELRPLVGRARRGHPVTSDGRASSMDARCCGDEESETKKDLQVDAVGNVPFVVPFAFGLWPRIALLTRTRPTTD